MHFMYLLLCLTDIHDRPSCSPGHLTTPTRYDGQTFVKPPEVLTRDRLLAAYEVRPVLAKLRSTLVGMGCILLATSVLLFGLIRAGTDEDGVYGERTTGGGLGWAGSTRMCCAWYYAGQYGHSRGSGTWELPQLIWLSSACIQLAVYRHSMQWCTTTMWVYHPA